MTAQLGLVLHVQQGNNSLAGWFNNPASGASSTFWVSKTGTLEQYVDSDMCAWAQGSGNSTYQSVETEGYDTEPLTGAQIDTLARLYDWGNQTYGWVNALAETPGQPGFAWHGMGGGAWGGHTGCPGDLRQPQRSTVLTETFGGLGPPLDLEADNVTSYFANNQHHVYAQRDDGTVDHWWLDTTAHPPGWRWEKLPKAA
jgi:hypothetical protein